MNEEDLEVRIPEWVRILKEMKKEDKISPEEIL